MKLKQIIISDQKELYRHKYYLLSLDLDFDSVKKEYKNHSQMNYDVELELIEFLRNNEFKYSLKEEDIVDFKQTILIQYKSLEIDANNAFIVEKKSNDKLYLLNQTKDLIQILDLKKSIFKSFKRLNHENTRLSLNVLEILASNQNDFSSLFEIYAILENQNSEDLFLMDKIKKYKYFCLSKIKSLQKDGFLCNCVPGFFPETNFYIKGDKIISSYTDYFLSYEQEFKVWKYLYLNKTLLGVYKEPTLEQMFFGRKIYTLDEFGSKVKRVIKRATLRPSGTIQITLSNGIKSKTLANEFTKEQLLNLVIEARD